MPFVEDKRQQILLLIAISLAAVMDGLDGSIVNIALPAIALDFGTDAGTVSWVVITYLLLISGLILVFGNLAGRGHIKKIFIIGFAVFTAASAVCGISPSLEILLAARIVQGIGGAMIIACAPLICVRFLPSRMLGVSFGVLTAATSIGFALGPALGGIIMQYLSWHWIFLINIPIGLFSIGYIFRVIPKGTPQPPAKFDTAGAVLLFIAMASGVFALERLPHLGFSNPGILAAAAVCLGTLVIFCLTELRSPHPIMNIRVFRLGRVTATLLAFLIMQIIYCGALYLIPFYLTGSIHADSLLSGLLLLIPPGITTLVSIPVGRWSDQRGRRWFCVAAGVFFVVFSLGFVLLVPEWGLWPLVIVLILMGPSIGIANGPGSGRVIAMMPPADREMGSSVLMTCIYLGAVLGTALYAAIFTVLTMSGTTVSSFADLDPALFLFGFHWTMAAGAGLGVLAIILSFIIKDPPRQ